MVLSHQLEHPHGISDKKDCEGIFTPDKPRSSLPLRLSLVDSPRTTYRREPHENLHVRGYKEENATAI